MKDSGSSCSTLSTSDSLVVRWANQSGIGEARVEHRLADWLQSCGVKTVALQSTGVYWIPLYDILEERGLEVYLVNARHTKNLPDGRAMCRKASGF